MTDELRCGKVRCGAARRGEVSFSEGRGMLLEVVLGLPEK